MNDAMEIESIIEPLITFLQSKNSTLPREFNRILDNHAYIQNTAISIFLAKTIRHIEKNNISISLNNNGQLSLPPSIYYGIIHPSSEINKFCRAKINEIHKNKDSINNLDDYTNIITGIFRIISQNLCFMRYTVDTTQFDKQERNTKINKHIIKSFINNNTNNGNINNKNVQYVEQHLYNGLKILIDKLS
eukprot:289635_1